MNLIQGVGKSFKSFLYSDYMPGCNGKFSPFKIICKLFINSWPIVNKTVILKRNAVYNSIF